MHAFRWVMHSALSVVALTAAGTSGAAGGGSGLLPITWTRAPAFEARDADLRPALRSRIAFGMSAPTVMNSSLLPQTVVSARLLGDYYFSGLSSHEGRLGGFRATGGMLLGSRLGAWGGAVTSAEYGASTVSVEQRGFGLLPPLLDIAGRDTGSAVPYVGVGYSNAFDKGRWGVSADVGLMALRSSAGGLRPGRAFNIQSVDDSLRDLRLAPMLQLGISYSF